MAEAQGSQQAQSVSARRTILRGLLFGGALTLAGCSSIIPRTAAPTGPQPAPTPTPTAPAPTGPTNALPTDNARHRVALLVPMSGSNAGVGEAIANATTLALLDTQTQRIRITTYDTNQGAAAVAQKALADGNELILGPLISDDVRAIAPITKRAHVPVISFSNDTSVAGDNVYLLGYTPAQSIARVVGYASKQGMRRFAGLVPTGLYGERSSSALLQAVRDAGGEVVSLQTYNRSPESLQAAVGKLSQGSDFDAILIADSSRIAAQAVPLVRKAGAANVHVLGTDLWNTDPNIGNDAALRGAWFASVSDILYNQLASKYRQRFGSAPYRLSSLGYDAVLLTVRIAGDWKVGAPFPTKALNDPGGFAGIDGAFRFDSDNVAQRALEVQEVSVNGVKVISAAPQGF